MMGGVPLETWLAVNERWNNKFCYKVASCWLFLLSHTTIHGSMNIKFKTEGCEAVSTVLYQTKRSSHSFKILTLQVMLPHPVLFNGNIYI
jgi:hypothetical protein